MAELSLKDIPHPEDKFLSIKQVATRYGVSVPMVHKLIAEGEIPAICIGTLYRIRFSDCLKYIERTPIK